MKFLAHSVLTTAAYLVHVFVWMCVGYHKMLSLSRADLMFVLACAHVGFHFAVFGLLDHAFLEFSTLRPPAWKKNNGYPGTLV